MFTFGLKVRKARKVIAELRREARQKVRFVSRVEISKDGSPVTYAVLQVDGMNVALVLPKKECENFFQLPSEDALAVRESFIDLLFRKLKRQYYGRQL